MMMIRIRKRKKINAEDDDNTTVAGKLSHILTTTWMHAYIETYIWRK